MSMFYPALVAGSTGNFDRLCERLEEIGIDVEKCKAEIYSIMEALDKYDPSVLIIDSKEFCDREIKMIMELPKVQNGDAFVYNITEETGRECLYKYLSEDRMFSINIPFGIKQTAYHIQCISAARFIECAKLVPVLRRQVSKILDEMGFSLPRTAREYLTESVVCAAIYPKRSISFKHTVIPYAAAKCNSSQAAAEKGLRYISDIIWDKCSSNQRQTYFGFDETSPFTPHSSDLILELADVIFDNNRFAIFASNDRMEHINDTINRGQDMTDPYDHLMLPIDGQDYEGGADIFKAFTAMISLGRG
ncbi:MAG: hypothetical protein IJ737_02510 [Ruminococcus sp.]|nr:hypothetical protein [Ruminococcus sp.]